MENLLVSVQNLEKRILDLENRLCQKTKGEKADDQEVLFMGRPINPNQGSWSPSFFTDCSLENLDSGSELDQPKNTLNPAVEQKTVGRRQRKRGSIHFCQPTLSAKIPVCPVLPCWIQKKDFVRERSSKRRKKTGDATEFPGEKLNDFDSTSDF